jgi:hypothetical protein
MRALIFLIAAVVAATPAAAQQSNGFEWKINEEGAPRDSSRASKGGFGVAFMVTDDYEGFWNAWEGPTPPQVSVTDRAERGKPVHAMLIFSGCKPAADGNCNLAAVYTITKPDGTLYGEPMATEVWGDAPAPNYNLQLSPANLGLVVEPEDPLGHYTFKATVTDHVAGVTLAIETPVEAVE